MFSKAKSSTGSATSNAVRASSKPGVPSIISADLRVIGNLVSTGDIHIDGTIEGDIESRTVTVAEGAQVHGSITAETVRICGSVHGEVKGASVSLAKSAKVVGDILHQTLAIEEGAFLEGHCRRAESAPKPAEAKVSLVKDRDASTAADALSPATGRWPAANEVGAR